MWLLALALAGAPAHAGVDVQFFGDVFIPERVLKATASSAESPRALAAMKPIFDDAEYNVVNLEGAVTTAFLAHESKTYLLKMPLSVPVLLKNAGINAVTLANNHAMDYGYQGLFDTLMTLRAAGIASAGAGKDSESAKEPLLLVAGQKTYCVLAYAKTYPESHWSKTNVPGVASTNLAPMALDIKRCTAQGFHTVVTFHWGQEGSSKALDYQRALARHAIDSGAVLVTGHHPHVLQEIEFYNGKPIVYSLGNFAFGTNPKPSYASGMSVGLSASDDGKSLSLVLTPLQVNNNVIHYVPRPLIDGESDPIPALLPKDHGCAYAKEKRHWTCLFQPSAS